MVLSPCFVYRLFNADGDLIYVGITGNVSLRLGQHGASKSWWPEVVDVKVDAYATRGDAMRVEKACIAQFSPRYNIHLHPTNRAKRKTRTQARTKSPSAMTYKVTVTREGSNWLADVPEIPGAHTFARSLDGLAKSVREVIVLMENLPDDYDPEVHFLYDVDDRDLQHAVDVGRERGDIMARDAEIQAETLRSVQALTARGYSVRDAARLLAITPGRVSQLANSQGPK